MDTRLIDSINSIEDFRRIPEGQLEELAGEIRRFLVEKVSASGGHLASNLGVVELTIALHRVFQSPADKLIFDVGHQSYVHKLLTGRRTGFEGLRSQDGLSGFPKREESPHDVFETGHSSTSVSAALGLLRAMSLKGETGRAVAVIGDGALTGGMAFEALNDAGRSELPLIVILNDNDMSISENVGALSNHLYKVRASRGYLSLKRGIEAAVDRIPVIGERLHAGISRLKSKLKYFLLPNVLFEELGYTYLGPVNGHDIPNLIEVFSRARGIDGPVLIHAITVKGRGYAPAERNPSLFHGIGRFAPDTGKPLAAPAVTNSSAAGEALCRLAGERDDLAVITAAMGIGTGMESFARENPRRFFDVGIAEQHAVTMAAGLAAGGMRPVVAVYSSFLQRAYDQIMHDVALQGLPVVFAIDRAGLVGEDGETHQGVYDIAYMLTMPGVEIYSPSTVDMLGEMLAMAVKRGVPAAVRYNRGVLPSMEQPPLEYGRWAELAPIAGVTVISTGRMTGLAASALRGLPVGLVDARFIRPMDEDMLCRISAGAKQVITIEDGLADGGLGSRIAERLDGIRVTRLGAPGVPVKQGSVAQQTERCGMDEGSIRAAALSAMEALKWAE